jgi:hypothetical protein
MILKYCEKKHTFGQKWGSRGGRRKYGTISYFCLFIKLEVLGTITQLFIITKCSNGIAIFFGVLCGDK